MKLAFWIFWSLASWSLYLAADIVLWLAGWIIVPVLAALHHYRMSESSKWPYWITSWKSKWAYPWGNEEDGIDGLRGYQTWSDGSFQQESWIRKSAGWSIWRTIVVWSAWRNPIGNLRFVKPFGFIIEPKKIQYWERNGVHFAWYFVRHGAYTGAWVSFRNKELKIGWNLRPTDAIGVLANDYRSKGCGFKLLTR